MGRLINIFILALLFTVTANLFAQQYPFQVYNNSDGLLQSKVNTISQDKKGYLWVGTLLGVSRFDGFSFHSYTKDDGLAEDWVTSSCFDINGNGWFGHWGGGLTKYIFAEDYFKSIELNVSEPVHSLIPTGNGGLWCAFNNGKLVHININTNEVKTINEIQTSSSFIGITLVNNRLVVCYSNKIIVINNQSKTIEKTISLNILTGSSSGIIAFAAIDNNLAFVTKNNQLCLFNGAINKTKKILTLNGDYNNIQLKGVGNQLFLFSSGYLQTIAVDKSGNVKSGRRLTTINGLPSILFNTLFVDSENDLWIGTDIGLYEYKGEGFLNFDETNGLNNNLVWSITSDKQNRIWAGTQKGLTVLDAGTYTPIASFFEDRSIVSVKNYSGFVLVLTANGEIYRFETGTNNIRAELVAKLNEDRTSFYDIGYTLDKTLLIATSEGLYRLTGPAFKRKELINSSNGLPATVISKILDTYPEHLYLVCPGVGLIRYNQNQFIPLTLKDVDQRFLITANINKQGELFLGTYKNGLYKVSGSTVKHYELRDKVLAYTPVAILPVSNGLWIGSYRGLGYLNLETGHFIHLGQSAGFRGYECNPYAIVSDNFQRIWLGSIMGATTFNPDFLVNLANAPNPDISSVSIGGIERAINNETQKLFYDQNNLSFVLNAVSMRFAEKISYRYRLFGLDTLIKNAPEGKVSFSNLAPGEYLLQLQASFNRKDWSKAKNVYSFKIIPPFWRTWWFALIVLLGLGVFLYILLKSKIHNILLEKVEIESRLLDINQQLTEKTALLRRAENEEKLNLQLLKPLIQDVTGNILKPILPSPEKIILNRNKEIDDNIIVKFAREICFLYILIEFTEHRNSNYIWRVIILKALNEFISANQNVSPSAIIENLYLKIHLYADSNQALSVTIVEHNIQQKEIKVSGRNSIVLFVNNKKSETLHFSTTNTEEQHYNAYLFQYFYLPSKTMLREIGADASQESGIARLSDFIAKNGKEQMQQQQAMLAEEINQVEQKHNLPLFLFALKVD